MSTPNPTHIIAEAMIDVDAYTWTVPRIAAHVVSKLTDAGYSIVPNADVEFGFATSDDPFIHSGVEEETAHRIAARYPNAHVVTRIRGPWEPAAAAEGEKRERWAGRTVRAEDGSTVTYDGEKP